MKHNKNQIKAIIFDLGGVLLNLDYQLTISAFTELGLHNSEALFSQKSQTSIFDDFETGKISAEKFRAEVRSLLPNVVTDEQIDTAWNTMLLDFPQNRFDLVKTLSTQYRIFLLSNTNEIHMAWFKNYINQLFGENVFFELFEVAYLSNEMGMRKPNKEIFDFVLNKNILDGESTLFIDDSAQHLVGAKEAGLLTHWLKPNEETVKILSHLLT